MKVVIFILFSLLALPVLAQDDLELSEPSWMDESYLNRQRASIEEFTTFEFGSRLRQDKSDLRLLNRVMERGLIGQTETLKQQALGVVLGDVFVSELDLEWKSYKDADGTSLAVCIPRSEHCLFPVTMLSKRMRLGVNPDADEMYEHGKSLLDPHLPKLPYSAK